MTTETIVNGDLKDLNTIVFGFADSSELITSHLIKQARINTIIHYVKEGKGYLEFENSETYEITKGNLFIVTAGVKYKYYPDKDDPWQVSWIVIEGNLSEDFNKIPPVIEFPPDIFEEIDQVHFTEGRKDVLLAIPLMKLYSELLGKAQNDKADRVEAVKAYIKANYMNPITVDSVAKEVFLHRSHLHRIFKKKTGMSIHDYIMKVRLSKTRELILEGKSITEAAYLCGFSSQTHLSSCYKKTYGESPSYTKMANEK